MISKSKNCEEMEKSLIQQKIRQKVWGELCKVALPDSRFHYDFEEFIPDFVGSNQATKRLVKMDIFKNSNVVFVTPDNCLEKLKVHILKNKKVLLTTAYGIRRGFIKLSHEDVPDGLEDYAILLDVIEKFGDYISLAEIQKNYKIDILVTGGSAVTRAGLRIGKGHGFFDIEWAILYSLGVVEVDTPIVGLVHDCQVIDENIEVNSFDTVCNYIVTPTQTIQVAEPKKPACGILWDKLKPKMIAQISPLVELKDLETEGKLRKGL